MLLETQLLCYIGAMTFIFSTALELDRVLRVR